MERLDRFFDFYGRITPQWFGDALAAIVLFVFVALIVV